MFGKMKEMLAGGTKRMAGKTDLLEGVCAAMALVIYADGNASEEELEEATQALDDHEVLSAAFKAHQIEEALDKQLKRAKRGDAGKLALKRELREAKDKNTYEDMEMLMAIVVDIAKKGGLEESEKNVLRDIGKAIGVTPDQFFT